MTVAPTITLDEAAGRGWDVVVVGGGPAGSVAAREVARRGRSVLLVEKATFPRPKVCGCCLNGAALGTLARIGLGWLVADCGAVPLGRVRVAAGGRSAVVRLPGGVALSREAFDTALVREAVAAGVEFLPATKAVRSAAGLTLNGAPVTAGVVVAADGLNGQLAGERPVVADGSRIGAGAVAAAAPGFYGPGTIFMAVGAGGYVGLVRLEDGRLDVAAAFDPAAVRAGGPGAAAESVLAAAGFPPVPGLAGLPWRGTPPLTRTARRVAGDRWFAVGDAAGYVEPFTGEGMAWAVASGAAVAPLAAAASVEWSDRFAAEWAAVHARLVRSRQRTCRAVARVLRSPRLTRVAVAAVAVLPALSRPVVAALNRSTFAPGPAA